MKVLCISGSIRRDSHNTKLLRAAGELFGDDVQFEIWEGLKAVPPYDEDDDLEPAPAAVAALRATVAAADAVLFATPEYNSSIPGQLKNALDWISRPLASNPMRDKPVVVIGASTGIFGAVWAQAELRKVLGAMGARVIEGELACGQAPSRFHARGGLADDSMREQLAGLTAALVAEAAQQAETRVDAETRVEAAA